jgi:hypothetical protein
LKADYYNDALYGLRQKVIIKYSLFDLSYINVYTTSGKFLCRADRITLTHPLAHYTGEIKDIEDYKQKIQKQKQLKRKTINSLKAYLPQEEVKLIEYKIEQPVVQTEFKECSIAVQGMFKNNSEKYEYLIKHNPDDAWITEFKKTKEYKLLYE